MANLPIIAIGIAVGSIYGYYAGMGIVVVLYGATMAFVIKFANKLTFHEKKDEDL